MIIEWSDKLSIGVPQIDAEHKLWIALVNGFYDQLLANKSQVILTDTFAHLIRYTERHFANEEALMRAVGYPEIDGHQERHLDLTDKASELSQQYLSGSKTVDVELMGFLKSWILHHILAEDVKIAAFLEGNPLPSSWGFKLAFSDSSEGCFKACTFCGAQWKRFEDFAADRNIVLLDQMIDRKNHFYNLLLFNCSCGTTLAIPLYDLVKNDPGGFFLEENGSKAAKPDYCLSAMAQPCLVKCACGYTSCLAGKLAASGTA